MSFISSLRIPLFINNIRHRKPLPVYGKGEEGIEKTVRWYLENQEWLDNVTSDDYQKYYDTMYNGR